ncbi:MAG: ABC transporter permease [Hyphomicrobiales bacterium]|nr:ABC transporter permease [Hyphomicrobiales bacterium]
MTALNKKLFRDLLRIWAQALAIALVIASGVALLVMAYGVARSLIETRAAYYERYRFADVFSGLTRAPVSLAESLALIPGVSLLEHRIVGRAIIEIKDFPEPVSGRLVSLPASEEQKLNQLVLRRGRMPHPGHNDEVIASEAFAEAHRLEPGAHLAALINGRHENLVLVGVALSPEYVYAIDPGAIIPDNKRFGVMWMQRPALAAAYNMDGAFNDVAMTLSLGADEAAVGAALDRALAPYGGTGAYSRRDQISNWYLSGELDQLELMVRWVPSIFLAVAMFLLHIAMSRLIDTERQEIGLLKAFGYSDGAVAWHYAKFTLAISLIGIAIGSAAGIWFGAQVTGMYVHFFRFPFLTFVLSPEVFATGALVAMATALAGVAVPALRAARLPPAVAMRPPAPARYRPTVIERIGMAGLFSGTSRMILRHIVRWPLRSGLTVASTALAVALYVSSAFMLDAMDLMIDIEFNRAQRQDLTVSFNHPVPPRALQELATIPGVLHAEGAHAVAARIRHGHLSRREAVIGVDPDSRLAQLLDSDLHPIYAPPRGMAMSRKLASLIDAEPGDIVRIEVLQDTRPQFDVPVVRLVEQYVGSSAFMDTTALETYLGEGPRVSSARLAIDGDRLRDIYDRLKQTPLVAGVSRLATARDELRTTIEENVTIMTLFNMGFAALIALGVVYNAARVSLSERGRELASLMVLGYSHAEAAAILVGEIALLTLLALPIGCLVGWALAGMLASAYETEVYSIPFIVVGRTYGMAVLVVVVSAVISGFVVARRVGRLDLVAVLKTRE